MAKKKGRALIFSWAGSKLGNVTSISLTVDGEIIDISDWDSGDWNDKLDGRKDWSMDIGLYHNPEGDSAQAAAEVDMISGTREDTAEFGPETLVDNDISYTGTAILSNFSIDAGGSDDPIESSLTIEGNGALSREAAHAIVAVDTTGDVVEIADDHTSILSAGDSFEISGSTGNDGTYTVASVTFNGTSGNTEITTNESISDATADGLVIITT